MESFICHNVVMWGMAQCEQCNRQLKEPAYVKTVPGYDGTIKLWFCEGCSA